MEVQIRILLVEDDAPLSRSLEKFLTNAGYYLYTCSDGREALIAAQSFRPDILISEYHLPDANGAVLLERLMRFVPDAVAVLISEYDFQSIADEIVRVHVHGFLKKPFDLAELETILTSACCQVRISMRNLEWNAEPAARVYLPPLTRGKLSDSSSRVDVEDYNQVRITSENAIWLMNSGKK